MCKWAFIFTYLITILTVAGCASSDDREPSSYSGGAEKTSGGSNAHPATALTEMFHLKRDLPKHKSTKNTEFFFKRCDISGDDWPRSNTAYDCNYP